MELSRYCGKNTYSFRDVLIGRMKAAVTSERDHERITEYVLREIYMGMHDEMMMINHIHCGRDLLPIIVMVETETYKMEDDSSEIGYSWSIGRATSVTSSNGSAYTCSTKKKKKEKKPNINLKLLLT